MAKRKTARRKTQLKKKGLRMAAPRTIDIMNGVVVEGDRHVELKRKAKVKWRNLSSPAYQVVFGSRTDPFTPGKVIEVPGNGESEEEVIRGLPGTYKYSVVQVSNDEEKDDPNIIIKS